jgi:hypothetical protein
MLQQHKTHLGAAQLVMRRCSTLHAQWRDKQSKHTVDVEYVHVFCTEFPKMPPQTAVNKYKQGGHPWKFGKNKVVSQAMCCHTCHTDGRWPDADWLSTDESSTMRDLILCDQCAS